MAKKNASATAAETRPFVVQRDIKLNGDRYAPDETAYLTDEQADPLLASGAIASQPNDDRAAEQARAEEAAQAEAEKRAADEAAAAAEAEKQAADDAEAAAAAAAEANHQTT